MRKLRAERSRASKTRTSRLCFYREDIEALRLILRRITESNHLEGCLVTLPLHGILLDEQGNIPPQLRGKLLREKRKGISLGWRLRLIGVAGEDIQPIEPGTAEELRQFLKQIAARKEFGEIIYREFAGPFLPRRA